jgi:hypothetical protein
MSTYWPSLTLFQPIATTSPVGGCQSRSSPIQSSLTSPGLHHSKGLFLLHVWGIKTLTRKCEEMRGDSAVSLGRTPGIDGRIGRLPGQLKAIRLAEIQTKPVNVFTCSLIRLNGDHISKLQGILRRSGQSGPQLTICTKSLVSLKVGLRPPLDIRKDKSSSVVLCSSLGCRILVVFLSIGTWGNLASFKWQKDKQNKLSRNSPNISRAWPVCHM